MGLGCESVGNDRCSSQENVALKWVVDGQVLLRDRIIHVSLERRRDSALRQNLRVVILDPYPVRPFEGEGTKKTDKIEREGVNDLGLLHWHSFLARQQSKNDEDAQSRWRQVGLGTHFGVSSYKLVHVQSGAENAVYFNRRHY